MLPRFVLSSAITLGVLALTVPSEAQRRAPAASAEETPEVLPPPSGEGDTGGANGPAADAPEKKAPVTPAAGYAYGDKKSASTRSTPRSRYRVRGPVVNMPGFEQTAEGGSRLFVQLSQSVQVEERKAQGSITYVLKGASPRVHNNTNALVTVHFNTPVARARLVPHGHDLHFVVDLRSDVAPVWKMNDAQDKSAMLTIDFPKGEFLQGTVPDAPRAERPARRGGRGKRGAPKAAPAPAKAPDGPTP